VPRWRMVAASALDEVHALETAQEG
jgi:hypothetical protein